MSRLVCLVCSSSPHLSYLTGCGRLCRLTHPLGGLLNIVADTVGDTVEADVEDDDGAEFLNYCCLPRNT